MPLNGKQIKAGTIANAQISASAAIALSKLSEAVIQADGGQAFTADQAMGGFKLTGLGAPVSASDAARKSDVDAVAAGIAWKAPVQGLQYLGSRTVVQIDALTPTQGDTVVATSAGTPAAGTSDLLAIGDVAEFDGTSWKKTIANVGGFVASGTRLVVDTAATLFAPLTDGTDDGKIATFDGASNTPTLTTLVNGDAVLNNQNISVTENTAFVFDGVVPTGSWVQFAGIQNLVAGAGLTKTGNTLDVGTGNGISVGANSIAVNPDAATGGNIQPLNVVANGAGLDVAAIVGTGIEADGAANVRLAAQGNGIAGGAGAVLSVNPDGASVAVGVAGVKSALPTASNQDMTASVTTADGDQATATTVAKANSGGGLIKLFVNGIAEEVGNGVKTKSAYISGDGGTTARAFFAVVATDTIHWNGSVAGFELAITDRLSLTYANTTP